MKSLLLVFILFFLSIPTFAQTHEIDSLEQRLKTQTKEDTVRLNLLNDLAFSFIAVDPEVGLRRTDEAIALARKINSQKHEGTAYNYKGLNYTYLGKDSLAIACYNTAIQIARKINNKAGEGAALNNLAILYVNQSEFRKALDIRVKVLDIFNQLKNKTKIGSILTNIGVIYFHIADYPKALDNYFKALHIAEETKNIPAQINATMNIGLVYKKMGSYSKALAYYEKCNLLNLQLDDQHNYLNNLGNIGALYDAQGLPDRAIKYYQSALTIAKKIKYKRGQANQLTNLGISYHSKGQLGHAMRYLNEALAIYQQSPDLSAMALLYNELANIVLNASTAELATAKIAKKDRFIEAERLTKQAIEISKEIEAVEREMAAWETLSLINQQRLDFKSALESYKHYTKLKDSIYNDDNKMNIMKQELQYQADIKQAVSSEEIKNQKTLRNYVLFGTGLLLLAATGVFILYKKHRDSVQRQNEWAHHAKVTDTEMKILRLQMNPHFIFNSLNSISDYMNKNDINSADYYLSKFAKLMRGILENSEEKEIPLADELAMLELYMQLEGSRLNNKFSYQIKVSDDIDPNITLVPPLILQPFVENSIWHGLANKDGGGKITIEVNREHSMINCIVEDDGIGRKGVKPASGKSYGMKITKDRIELLNRFKNTNASVNLIDLDKGTRIEVKLPFETEG